MCRLQLALRLVLATQLTTFICLAVPFSADAASIVSWRVGRFGQVSGTPTGAGCTAIAAIGWRSSGAPADDFPGAWVRRETSSGG